MKFLWLSWSSDRTVNLSSHTLSLSQASLQQIVFYQTNNHLNNFYHLNIKSRELIFPSLGIKIRQIYLTEHMLH